MLSSTLKIRFHDGIYIISFMQISGYSIFCLQASKRSYFQQHAALILWNKVLCPCYRFLYEAQIAAAASPLYWLVQLISQICLSAVWQFKGNSFLMDLLPSSEKCVLWKKCTICTSVTFQASCYSLWIAVAWLFEVIARQKPFRHIKIIKF